MPIRPFEHFARDEDGAIAVIVALMLLVLMGFTALGVDTASLYRERAKLQSASDLTAMSAVADTASATPRAQAAVQRNDHQADSLKTLELGRFLRNPALPADQRFTVLPEGATGINAVRVALQHEAPLHFAQIFTDDTHVALTRRSIASRTGAASFSLDSHIANMSDGALNDVLEQQFGAEAAISASDLDVLAGTQIDAATLLAALGLDVGRNPAEVLNGETTGAAFIQALQTILPPAQAGALDGLRSNLGDVSFEVSSLIGGIDTDLGITATDFLSQVDISALDALRAAVVAQTANQSLDVATDVNAAGVLSTATTLTVGEPAARSGLIAIGEEGTTLHRAAARLKTQTRLQAGLLSNLGAGIEVASVNLPIYAELAGATATLDELSCDGSAPENLAARFVTAQTPLHPGNGTSVAALYLGHLPDEVGAIDPISLGFADVLEVNVTIELPLLPDVTIAGLTIQARSHVTVGTSRSETVSFSHADIANGDTTRTFGSGAILSSATASLLSPEHTELRIKPGQEGLVSGLAAPLVAALMSALPERLLAGLAAPVDNVLDTALNATGLELGAGELELTAHHCEQVRLVQ